MRDDTRRPPKNQDNACEAVLRILERRAGCRASNFRYPEVNGGGAPVDLVARLGGSDFALEHTLIEAYEGQIEGGLQFDDVLRPVKDALSGSLPTPGLYELTVSVDALKGVSLRKHQAIQRALIEWVQAKACELHARIPGLLDKINQPHGHYERIVERPPEVPFEITFSIRCHWAQSDRFNGVLAIGRWAPPNLERDRLRRIQRALNDKCPKLQEWKIGGAVSVLILESHDIALTNEVVIAESLLGELKSNANIPDEIYLVNTEFRPWLVTLFKAGDIVWPEIGDSRGAEFDPDELAVRLRNRGLS